MIKFFRKIRFDLLEKNKTGRYLKYAIGEIILVVIGILIALQINTWNEEKKNKEFEREILAQILVNLSTDKENLLQISSNFSNAMRSSSKIINGSGTPDEKDSLKFWLGNVIQFDRFQPLTNAYEVAKSKGLDLITNKKLRFLLGTYYDDQVKHAIKAIEDIEKSFNNDWVPYLRQEVKEMTFKSVIIPRNKDQFFTDSYERRVLTMNYDNFSSGQDRILIVIEVIKSIEKLITRDLNNS